MGRNGLRQLRGVALLLAIGVLTLFWTARHDQEQRSRPDRDPELYALQTFLRYPWLPAKARERAQEAMGKYQNDTLDPEPVLIVATLGRSTGADRVYLGL